MSTEKITSLQNPKIKNLKKLEKAGERRAQNMILIEGIREIMLAYRAGYEITSLFVCHEILTKEQLLSLKEIYPDATSELNRKSDLRVFEITKEIYDSLAYRETTEGIIATATPKKHALENLRLQSNPLLLVIESVEKPGNLGALFRTCDAAGVDAVIICDAKTDLYNPNVIRSSVGTVFTNQVALCATAEAISFLNSKGICTFAATPAAEKIYYDQNFDRPSAILVGTEATGLSSEWMKAANEGIRIPMLGKIDSLNVSVSAGILLFEALRQRTPKSPSHIGRDETKGDVIQNPKLKN